MWLTSQEDTDNNTKDAGDDYNDKVSQTAPEEGHIEEDQSVSVEDRVTNWGVVTEKESVTKDQCITEDQSVTEEASVGDKEDDCRVWDTYKGSYSPRKTEVLYMRRFSNQPNREDRSQGPHRSFSFPPSHLQPSTFNNIYLLSILPFFVLFHILSFFLLLLFFHLLLFFPLSQFFLHLLFVLLLLLFIFLLLLLPLLLLFLYLLFPLFLYPL